MRLVVSGVSRYQEKVRPDDQGAAGTISRVALFDATKGMGGLALDDRNKKMATSDEGRAKPRSTKSPQQNNLGNALRTVYQEAVNEEVPQDLLDLLGKLR
ncbi:NepR family anti-sigma factor [Flavisphingomonas formosensis]|uniref:NepR family anti-sigma factor n=1 Tax=Flavisphingomonas formosensis TaxID=861534 RepID=UPI0012FA1CAB|nr:NepR family anti-sigma factor [Sphingomonas formosensis]